MADFQERKTTTNKEDNEEIIKIYVPTHLQANTLIYIEIRAQLKTHEIENIKQGPTRRSQPLLKVYLPHTAAT